MKRTRRGSSIRPRDRSRSSNWVSWDLSAYATTTTGLSKWRLPWLALAVCSSPCSAWTETPLCFPPDNTAYVAVFDISKPMRKSTRDRIRLLKGIPLTIRNPNNDLVVVAAENALYVQGCGAITPVQRVAVSSVLIY